MDLDDEELKVTRMMNGADRNSRVRVNNDIEVNEYIRTNKGNIGKVVEIRLGFNKDTQLYQNVYMLDNGLWTILEYIVNHSKQLIDLIGCGDIVNRHLIIDKYEDVDEYGNDFWCLIIEDDSLLNRSIREENIQTILTKESYMANCYKVGGEE